MPAITRLAATVVPALAAVVLSPAAASADTVVVADPTARNVTSYGVTSAWSRQAADGRFRLVVMGAAGTPADANVRSASVPFHPDLGPAANNARVIVYSRCAEGSSTKACDVYAYDVGARAEHKVRAVSGRDTSEIGPSQFKGAVAFGRTGARGGLYLYRPGRPSANTAERRRGSTRKIGTRSGYEFDQTDLSATRVIARATARNRTLVRLSDLDGTRARIVARGERHEEAESVVASPVLARYRAFWLSLSRELDDPNFGGRVETVSVRSLTRTVGRVDRPWNAVDGVALGSNSQPGLFSGPAGISRISPRLTFAP